MLVLRVKISFAEFVVSRDSEVTIKDWIWPLAGACDVAERGLL